MTTKTTIDISPKKNETLIDLAKRAINQSNLNNRIVHIMYMESVTVVTPNSDYVQVLKVLKIKELKTLILNNKEKLKSLQAQ